jgi:hypothetical protein
LSDVFVDAHRPDTLDVTRPRSKPEPIQNVQDALILCKLSGWFSRRALHILRTDARGKCAGEHSNQRQNRSYSAKHRNLPGIVLNRMTFVSHNAEFLPVTAIVSLLTAIFNEPLLTVRLDACGEALVEEIVEANHQSRRIADIVSA